MPIKAWSGVRSAESYGLQCPNYDDLNEMTQSDREKEDLEDCLILAIYTANVQLIKNCEYKFSSFFDRSSYILVECFASGNGIYSRRWLLSA